MPIFCLSLSTLVTSRIEMLLLPLSSTRSLSCPISRCLQLYRTSSRIRDHRCSLSRTKGRQSSSKIAFPNETEVVFLSTVLPEPNSSAAGVRSEWLLRSIASSPGIAKVHYIATTSAVTSPNQGNSPFQARDETLASLTHDYGINFLQMLPNQAKETHEWIATNLSGRQNVLVLFDRFYVEEMFSHYFHEALPDESVLVLDMQDMHSLRSARENAVPKQSDTLMPATSALPSLSDSHLLRELSSIQRCDLTLVCSTVETHMLEHDFGIPPSKLCTSPMLFNPQDSIKRVCTNLQWQDRKDLCFIGNFLHKPNVDAVRQLQRLWPKLEKLLPADTNIHIYGAYYDPSKHPVSRNKRFKIHGYCEDISAMMSAARLMLAPLQFGAGLKGKIVEAWRYSLPVVTTSIGSEGLVSSQGHFPGKIADTDEEFLQAVTKLYSSQSEWNACMYFAPSLLERLGARNTLASLARVMESKTESRDRDIQRAILWQTSQQSSKYMSRWIECKNKLATLSARQDEDC